MITRTTFRSIILTIAVALTVLAINLQADLAPSALSAEVLITSPHTVSILLAGTAALRDISGRIRLLA